MKRLIMSMNIFSLKAQNEELAVENARLKSLLFNTKDTTAPLLSTSKEA